MAGETVQVGEFLLKIASAKVKGGELHIKIHGNSPDAANSAEARKLAYEHRLEHGFANAGIEGVGGPEMVVPEDGQIPIAHASDAEQPERWWCKTFRVKPSL